MEPLNLSTIVGTLSKLTPAWGNTSASPTSGRVPTPVGFIGTPSIPITLAAVGRMPATIAGDEHTCILLQPVSRMNFVSSSLATAGY
eukprot:gene17855-12800_t